MPQLIVVSSATEAYFFYVLPHIASVLYWDEQTDVEIFVESGGDFPARSAAGLDYLSAHFRGRFDVTQVDSSGEHPSVTRFIHRPKKKARYVYIGDVDMLVLEAIAPRHLRHMHHGLPYTNKVRRDWSAHGVFRMTGLHFSEYDAYYPVEIPAGFDITDQQRGIDERLLYEMVKQRWGEPPAAGGYRPVHGLHLSLSGWPCHPRWGWGLPSEKWQAKYLALSETSFWKGALPFFDPRYRALLKLLDASIEAIAAFPEDRIADLRVLSGPREPKSR